jgi:hypothetical protein
VTSLLLVGVTFVIAGSCWLTLFKREPPRLAVPNAE